MAPRSSNGRLTGELRRFLKLEIDRRVRDRPDFIPPEKLGRLQNHGARELDLVCVVCGSAFTSSCAKALTCTDACRQALWRQRRRHAGPEAIAA